MNHDDCQEKFRWDIDQAQAGDAKPRGLKLTLDGTQRCSDRIHSLIQILNEFDWIKEESVQHKDALSPQSSASTFDTVNPPAKSFGKKIYIKNGKLEEEGEMSDCNTSLNTQTAKDIENNVQIETINREDINTEAVVQLKDDYEGSEIDNLTNEGDAIEDLDVKHTDITLNDISKHKEKLTKSKDIKKTCTTKTPLINTVLPPIPPAKKAYCKKRKRGRK